MSSFYKRHNLQLRISLMFSSASLAGAFSGLLAAAIQQLHARGIPGWGWIFILEGVFTSLFGIFSFFVLPRTPESTLFLKEDEKIAYRESLKADWSGDMDGEMFKWSEVFKAFRAPHVLLICIPLFFNGATVSFLLSSGFQMEDGADELHSSSGWLTSLHLSSTLSDTHRIILNYSPYVTP
jgi:MFS family permease